MTWIARWRRLDPRLLQIAFLASFLAVGVAKQAVPAVEPLLTLAAALLTQALFLRWHHLSGVGQRSAIVTALGTAALLRSDLVWLPPLCCSLAVASKFTLRVGERRLFNPANFGVVVGLLSTAHAWVSPSQWGESAALGAWIFALGCAVVSRAFRADVSFAFLGATVLLKAARVLYLGQRPAVLLHQLTVGSLLIFTFFMISDPKTTPRSRAGRIALGVCVAALAFELQTKLWVQTAPLWALFVLGPLFVVLGEFAARRGPSLLARLRGSSMRKVAPAGLLLLALFAAPPARAFCGFYVAKADAQLFNHASQVVLVRDQNHTVLTMASDFKGALTEFAVVVPVPSVLAREQIHIGDPKLVERLDAWSAPRLVEYFDPNPCEVERLLMAPSANARMAVQFESADLARASALGVAVEAQYTVGEYDIVLLSAKQSGGLQKWLEAEGYRIPTRAAEALAPYVRQNMKFFVAKVNIKEQAKTGYSQLRPIQIAYESEKFMLPIRLGMANAEGPQDLLIYALTRKGRVESTNYRTVKMPTDEKVPLFVKDAFKEVYPAVFERSYEKEDKRALFTEYSWSAANCDPCADAPLSAAELRGLGVYWLNDAPTTPTPGPVWRRGLSAFSGQPFVTRLHVRYDREHFPEDLVFQETGDQQSYQARYVLTHAFTGELKCDAADRYRQQVDDRHAAEVTALAALTGWSREKIAARMGSDAPGAKARPWYDDIWR